MVHTDYVPIAKHTVANNGRYGWRTALLPIMGGVYIHRNQKEKQMKKTIKLAAAAVVLSTPAMAANMENPLYLPRSGEVYSKTGAGVMYKIADDSAAHIAKNHDGATEFPIYRISEELGVGVTDRLAVRGAFGYTHDGDIDRKGMHHGRLGVIYRAFDRWDGFKMDLYADAHLGGISDMTGAYTPVGFDYDNYSNGRWGMVGGVRFGKTWSRLTTSAFAEILHTFGSDNNEIDVTTAVIDGTPLTSLGLPNEISVDLKGTTEFNFGLNAFFEIDDRWSVGGLFKFTQHADNGVEGLSTDVDMSNPATAAVVSGLEAMLSDMDDGFTEFMFGASVAYQMTDTTQVALYGEYTFDDAHAQSQNGTDVKAEVGVRMNVRF